MLSTAQTGGRVPEARWAILGSDATAQSARRLDTGSPTAFTHLVHLTIMAVPADCTASNGITTWKGFGKEASWHCLMRYPTGFLEGLKRTMKTSAKIISNLVEISNGGNSEIWTRKAMYLQCKTVGRWPNHCCRGKTIILHILSVCSLSYPTCKPHVPYCIVICVLSASTTFFIFIIS